MNFNIKLNALLWEICKLGRAAAACTSWNSVHSVVINRQQVIWESLGLVSGVTNSIWTEAAFPGSWLGLEEHNCLLVTVPAPVSPKCPSSTGPRPHSKHPSATGVLWPQLLPAFPSPDPNAGTDPAGWAAPTVGRYRTVSPWRKAGTCLPSTGNHLGLPSAWGGSGLVLVASLGRMCQHYHVCYGLRSLLGMSREILC